MHIRVGLDLLPHNGNIWNRFQVGFNPMQQDVQGKVDSRAMREVNRSIVLDIIRRGGKVSRTDLAKRSALTKPTVSAIVDDLIARGIAAYGADEARLLIGCPKGGIAARLGYARAGELIHRDDLAMSAP